MESHCFYYYNNCNVGTFQLQPLIYRTLIFFAGLNLLLQTGHHYDLMVYFLNCHRKNVLIFEAAGRATSKEPSAFSPFLVSAL